MTWFNEQCKDDFFHVRFQIPDMIKHNEAFVVSLVNKINKFFS